MSDVYFFGCIGDYGHFLWEPSKSWHVLPPADWPWDTVGVLDGTFAPKGSRGKEQQLGRAKVTHYGGWTVLAMWDRSVDHRFNSNAAFVVRGEHDFEKMLELAREHFPRVLARIEAQAPLEEVRA